MILLGVFRVYMLTMFMKQKGTLKRTKVYCDKKTVSHELAWRYLFVTVTRHLPKSSFCFSWRLDMSLCIYLKKEKCFLKMIYREWTRILIQVDPCLSFLSPLHIYNNNICIPSQSMKYIYILHLHLIRRILLLKLLEYDQSGLFYTYHAFQKYCSSCIVLYACTLEINNAGNING